MLKQSLQQKLSQRLSPQQIQLMKLLQLPTVALEQRVKEELEVNPALDEGREEDEEEEIQEQEEEKNEEEEFDFSDYIDDDTPDYKYQANNHSKDDEDRDIPYSGGMTFPRAIKQSIESAEH